MSVLLLIAVPALALVAFLAWVAARSWAAFARLTLLPILLASLGVGMSWSIADWPARQIVPSLGLEALLLGAGAVAMAVLSAIASLLGPCMRGLRHWRSRSGWFRARPKGRGTP
ncbi:MULTISPECIES: hypothetical protein [Gammaproteobacteria]|uniref:hypothetical protein n=1 Tax=Gammaproteobacteria TaxID=1236 RepID=UPI0011291F3D|nr:hypothetical protein [Pseudomonas sp. Hp2]